MYRDEVYHEFPAFGRYFASLRVRKAPRQLQGFVAAQPGGACGKVGQNQKMAGSFFSSKKFPVFL